MEKINFYLALIGILLGAISAYGPIIRLYYKTKGYIFERQNANIIQSQVLRHTLFFKPSATVSFAVRNSWIAFMLFFVNYSVLDAPITSDTHVVTRLLDGITLFAGASVLGRMLAVLRINFTDQMMSMAREMEGIDPDEFRDNLYGYHEKLAEDIYRKNIPKES